MRRFNGKFGCTFCLHQTENVDSFRKYPIYSTVPVDRTDESIKESTVKAFNEGAPVDGIKGPSILMNLEEFDLAEGMVLDDMHCVDLGAAKQHTELLVTETDEPYYIGSPNQMSVIHQRFLSIQHPKLLKGHQEFLPTEKIGKPLNGDPD